MIEVDVKKDNETEYSVLGSVLNIEANKIKKAFEEQISEKVREIILIELRSGELRTEIRELSTNAEASLAKLKRTMERI